MKIKTENIHPSFFYLNRTLKKFNKTRSDSGLILHYKDKKLTYSDGELISDDQELLEQVHNIIKKSYGSYITRSRARSLINFNNIPDHVQVVNVGTCELKKSNSGWNGSINSIWYDDMAPGKVLKVSYTFSVNTKLFG
jgi:hypothetical protein